jgi:hypothetical protein
MEFEEFDELEEELSLVLHLHWMRWDQLVVLLGV